MRKKLSPSNPVVKIRWEGWESAALTITIAAMILQERMGVEVEFVSSDGTFSYESVYEQLASGEVDAAFEVWLPGNEEEFEQYASLDTSGDKPVIAFELNRTSSSFAIAK